MKKSILLVMVFIAILIQLAAGLEECQRVTSISNIPCQIVSTWSPADCAAYSAVITNESGVNIQNLSWMNLTAYQCTMTWNLTSIGSYFYNGSINNGAITVEEDSNMTIGIIILLPLLVSFLLIYWANSLGESSEEKNVEPLKWFMRMLSFIFVFIMVGAVNIYISTNQIYLDLLNLFDMTIYTWVFYTLFAVFLLFFIYKIFMSFKVHYKQSFDNGEL